MPIYNYKAKAVNGKVVKGKVEAGSIKAAAAVLKEKELFLINISQQGYTSKSTDIGAVFDKVKVQDIVNFTRQLATMITAGLTLTQCLRILQNQSRPAMQKVLAAAIRDIEGGSTFADALAKQSTIFPKVYVALVRSGEAAGVLDQILTRLADNLEKQYEFAAKTKGALVYPVIVFIGMFGVTFIMMVFVIPKLTAMYADFGAKLPAITQALIDISHFAQNYWFVVIGALLGTIAGFSAWRKTESGLEITDRFKLKMPVFGPLQIEVMMAEFTRTLSLMLGAGVSLLQTLEIVGGSLDNVVFRNSVKAIAKDIEKGSSFAESTARQPFFPQLVSQMISVGEETGKLDEVLIKVSAFFESESEHKIKNLSTALEPIIMVVLGVGVGFLVVAIIMPIYDLTNKF